MQLQFHSSNSDASTRSARRSDIQGLRTLGALLVAAFHIWEGGISGGVDVFFVVSGYFLGVGYAKNLEKGQFLLASDHFGRFLRRTVPEVLMVLVAILALGLLFVPLTQWVQLLRDVAFSAVYLENYWLIRQGQDYLSRGQDLSLAQHFWAVSVIAQAYAIWFFLTRLSEILGRWRWSSGFILAVILGLLAAFSLGWSIIGTRVDPVSAYFDLLTRYWQFAFGALLGLWTSGRSDAIPDKLANPLSWVGLGLILSCGVVIGNASSFPGYAALWPVGAAILIIIAGRSVNLNNAGRWLGIKPLAWLGTYSFGIYLWHWPIYVVVLRLTGQTPSILLGLFIIVLSMILAYGSHHATEWLTDFLRKSWRPIIIAGIYAAGLVAVAGSALAMHTFVVRNGHVLEASSLFIGPDARAIKPGPLSVRRDIPASYPRGCHQNQTSSEVLRCDFGDQNAVRTLFLVGGSHSAHWLPGLDLVAKERGWRIVSITKSACLFASAEDQDFHESERNDPSCKEWNRMLIEELIDERPDVVVTLATRPLFERYETVWTSAIIGEQVPQAYIEHFIRLTAEDIPVVAIRDNPWMGHDVPDCVFSRLSVDVQSCGKLRAELLDDSALEKDLNLLPRGVIYIDMSNAFCDEVFCDVVRDGILMYRDRHHLTATYAEYLGPYLFDQIEEGLQILQ